MERIYDDVMQACLFLWCILARCAEQACVDDYIGLVCVLFAQMSALVFLNCPSKQCIYLLRRERRAF